jgi:trk system potassium uptake protein TrkA
MEINVGADSRVAGKTLRETDFPKGSVVGAIIRKDEVIMPRGGDAILPGDRAIVVALPDAIPGVERLLA